MRGLAKFGLATALAATLAFGAAGAVSAAGWGGGHGGPGFAGRGFAPGMPGWSNGRWFHGRHGVQSGWWWNAGSSWYLYQQPVYPYPAYLPGTTSYDGSLAAGEDDTNSYPDYSSTGNPQAYEEQQGGNLALGYQYYCERPRGYYPEVLDCDNWQELYLGKPVHYYDER